jgi:5-formyltetrahydrofolate cyclo-ligase
MFKMFSKQELRSMHLRARKDLSRDAIIDASLAILSHLKPLLQDHVVGLYAPIQNEVDVSLLFRSNVALPSIEHNALVFRQYQEPLVPGAYGIMESTGDVCHPTLIVVPGIAFGPNGARLGYGKGYYDQYLTEAMCKIGVCMEEFYVSHVPVDAHDVRMNKIITPSGVKEIRPCTR